VRLRLVPIYRAGKLERAAGFRKIPSEHQVFVRAETDKHSQRLLETDRILRKETVSGCAFEEFEIPG
jgi:hypothetical protein